MVCCVVILFDYGSLCLMDLAGFAGDGIGLRVHDSVLRLTRLRVVMDLAGV